MNEQNEEHVLEAEPATTAAPEHVEQGAPVADVFAQLRYIDNSGPTEQLLHVGASCIVGRFDPAVTPVDIDLTDLPDSKFVSRRHATISHEDGAWYVTDHGSSNGTYLYRKGQANFIKVGGKEAIEDGDEIGFGNLRFRFEVPPPFVAEEEPAVESSEPPA